jgi:hypothetical protein
MGHKDNEYRLSRRAAMSGLALGGAGLAAGFRDVRAAKSSEWTLDLDAAEDNCKAIIKLQADISGADTMGGFPGEVWAWVPDEGNFHLFNTYGVGVSHVEYMPEERAWRFYHREALLYLDPQTNEIVDSWYNRFTRRRVEVLHIFNEHVNRYYKLDGGPFPFPWTYETHGDSLVFRISVFRLHDNVMSRKEDGPRGDFRKLRDLLVPHVRLAAVYGNVEPARHHDLSQPCLQADGRRQRATAKRAQLL